MYTLLCSFTRSLSFNSRHNVTTEFSMRKTTIMIHQRPKSRYNNVTKGRRIFKGRPLKGKANTRKATWNEERPGHESRMVECKGKIWPLVF